MSQLLVFLAICAVLIAFGWWWPLACYVCFLVGGFGGQQVGRSEARRGGA